MALETLKNLEEVDGFKVDEIPCIEAAHEGGFIKICHGSNTISFRIQNGPIKENGENGCQVDTIIKVVTIIIKELNGRFQCRENALAITKLEEASMWLKARKENRICRGVEGKNIA